VTSNDPITGLMDQLAAHAEQVTLFNKFWVPWRPCRGWHARCRLGSAFAYLPGPLSACWCFFTLSEGLSFLLMFR
jgi:hypothetical protein